MAKVQTRQRSDGGVSYRVMWVVGGGRPRAGAGGGDLGSQASETFTDRKLMLAFKGAVEAQHHQWPIGWVKGRGWVDSPTTTVPPVTLDEVMAAWFSAEQEKIILNRKKPKSVGRDRRTYQLHIEPAFGSRPFTSITRQDVRSWVLAMAISGAKPKTVHNRHGLLFQIMRHGGIEMGLRVDNPCQGTALPRDDYDRQILFFTHGEWAVVRACLRSDVHLMCDIALHTGVRWGELSALRVGDISVAPRNADEEIVLNINVVRAWSERDKTYDDAVIDTAAGETIRYKLGPTKSRRGRWVQVSGELAEQLWASLASKPQDDYVFTTAHDNPWRYPDFHSDRWAPAIALAKEHGLTKHGTFHMLRHSFVVWLLAGGESIFTISARVGHASIQITMDRYGGLLDLHDAGTTKRMARQMAYAETALLPVDLRREDVDSRPVRPGRRGERRLRRVV